MSPRKSKDFTEQDRINMEAEAEREQIEAREEIEAKEEKAIAKARKKAKVNTGRMQHDRNQRR